MTKINITSKIKLSTSVTKPNEGVHDVRWVRTEYQLTTYPADGNGKEDVSLYKVCFLNRN